MALKPPGSDYEPGRTPRSVGPGATVASERGLGHRFHRRHGWPRGLDHLAGDPHGAKRWLELGGKLRSPGADIVDRLTQPASSGRQYRETNSAQGTAVAPPTQLAADLRARRAGVIDDLLATYGRELQGVAYLIVRNHADAEEITMDTLVSAWKHAGSLREDAALRTWLLRIATRHALSHQRRRRPTQPLEASQPIRARSADPRSDDGGARSERVADAD